MARGNYRKHKNSDTWHFCTNCSEWPVVNYDSHTGTKPTYGELCNQCLGKERAGDCS